MSMLSGVAWSCAVQSRHVSDVWLFLVKRYLLLVKSVYTLTLLLLWMLFLPAMERLPTKIYT